MLIIPTVLLGSEWKIKQKRGKPSYEQKGTWKFQHTKQNKIIFNYENTNLYCPDDLERIITSQPDFLNTLETSWP